MKKCYKKDSSQWCDSFFMTRKNNEDNMSIFTKIFYEQILMHNQPIPKAFKFSKDGEGIILDHDRYMLLVQGDEILLQRKEFEIISLLASKPKKVFSRDEIKEMVWDEPNHLVRNRTIDVHIRNLRIKIGRHYIKTYKGIGYSFDTSLAS